MKHRLRKYIGKRGSALFMVLSVMTALIVTSLAMYFSVVSSRKTQYAIFNQQQSYQSALSLSESLLGGIIKQTDDANMTGMQALANAVYAMSVGDTITTSGNGFYSFDESGSRIDEDQVGAYIADITCLSENSEGKLFDFAVTTMVNGTESTAHQYVILNGTSTTTNYIYNDPDDEPDDPDDPDDPPPGGGGGGVKLPLFICSGLVPTSPALKAGYMYSDVFYDAENALFMPTGANGCRGNAQLKTLGDVFVSGSLTVNYKLDEADARSHVESRVQPKAHTWVIRKDLIMTNSSSAVHFNEPDSSMYPGQNNTIIVGGDLSFKSSAKGFENCEIYVLGNVTIEDGSKIGTNVKIYAMGTVTGSASGTNVSAQGGCNLNRNYFAQMIEKNTRDRKYYDWDISYGRKARACDGEKETDANGNAIIYPIEGINDPNNHVVAHFVRTGGTPEPQFVWAPNRQGYVITGVDGFGGETGGNADYENYDSPGYKLVIDTGDNPENVLTIVLKGYLDGGKTFSWCSKYGDYATWVVVRGKGSVVFVVEDGVTYENTSFKTNVLHEKWTTNGAFGSQQQRDQAKNIIMKNWIHYECGDECCVNPLTEISGKKCKYCGGKMYSLKCSDHPLNEEVCLNKSCSEGYEKYRSDGHGGYESYGSCEYRIETKKKGNDAPNMNIFLVMCGKNSKLKFTPPEYVKNNGRHESFSSFWGYIYAPYTTLVFSCESESGDKTQFVGGLAVGSLDLFGKNTYVPAYPDRLPNNVMPYAATQHELQPLVSKDWKVPLSSNVSG